ncbi:Alb1-domain-containing protein [Paraphoma chrysanthemicola]|nr:Alb1-domain-containing protein [Paraphoma chrysanthemicola]
MAKTAKVKKRQVTVHSRAARRAASPSIDLDKKLKQTTRDSASPSRPAHTKPHALSAQNAGIQKKAKKSTMTRAQRLRHQKGLERAAAVLDKRHVKVVKSLDKEKTVKERSKGWEDVNGDSFKSKKGARSPDADSTEQAHARETDWVSDEDMDGTDADVDAAEGPTVASQDAEVKAESKQVDLLMPASVPVPVEEDELL